MITVAPGSGLTIEAFLQAWAPELLRGYQVQIDPAGYASGQAGSLSLQPGGALIDAARADFAFIGFSTDPADEQAVAAVDTSTPATRWAAALFDPSDGAPDPSSTVYLATLEVQVSADAAGTFTLSLDPGATVLGDDSSPSAPIVPLALSPVIIQVGVGVCSDAADCGDLDNDGIRDDACAWYDCAAGACATLGKTTQADLGGAFGACTPDGATDGNDRFHALNCFSNKNTLGVPPYPCEAATPAALNVDAGGPATCQLDGVCDGNDAFHALNGFENDWFDGSIGYQCGCAGPGPVGGGRSADPSKPAARSGLAAALRLLAPATVRPGEIFAVDVHLDGDVAALRGYQLHLGTTGGIGGELELVDISIRESNVFSSSDKLAKNSSADPAAPNAAAAFWSAFNRDTAQMVAGLDDAQGVPAVAGAYLATFTYRVPEDATGTFTIEVRYDATGRTSPKPQERTFLFGPYAGLIDVTSTTPARIEVSGRPNR
jgi:hypothetical protein